MLAFSKINKILNGNKYTSYPYHIAFSDSLPCSKSYPSVKRSILAIQQGKTTWADGTQEYTIKHK